MPEPMVTVFYDGHCALCHGFVRFLLARDRGVNFDFAPLQGEFSTATIPEKERTQLPDSIVVRTAEGQLLVKSSAVLYVLARLGGWWLYLGGAMRIFPRPVRDLVYDGVAGIRRKIFPRPAAVCPIVAPELRSRFHP